MSSTNPDFDRFVEIRAKRQALDSVKTRREGGTAEDKEKLKERAKLLMQEKDLAYSLAINLFVKDGDFVAIPYCGFDKKVPNTVLQRVGKKGVVYLVDNDPNIITELKQLYPQDNAVKVEDPVPRTRERIPKNIDIVVTNNIRGEANENDLFAFLDWHLKPSGYFIDFLFESKSARPFTNPNYSLVDHPFNVERSMVNVYQKVRKAR